MAIQFHTLPVHVFPKVAQPSIHRLNRELRDLFGLESTNSTQISTKRSDNSIAKKETKQVHISRITPTVTTLISSTEGSIPREATLGTAPSMVVFKVVAGPPDTLYVSLNITGGSWNWVPIVRAP